MSIVGETQGFTSSAEKTESYSAKHPTFSYRENLGAVINSKDFTAPAMTIPRLLTIALSFSRGLEQSHEKL